MIERVYDTDVELGTVELIGDRGTLHDVERALRVHCAALDPDAVPLAEVLPLFRCLARIGKLAEGAELRLARKLEEAKVGRVDGCRDTAEFLARATGTSVGAARDALVTSERLASQPATDAAPLVGV